MNVNDDKPEDARTIYVALKSESELSEAECRKLLNDADEDYTEVIILDPDEDNDTVEFCATDTLIIPLEKENADDNGVERLVLRAARAVSVIIGVWKPGESEDTIHPTVAKYGRAQIPWDANKLKTVIDTDCPPAFQTPAGSAAISHDVPPNKC